RDALAELRFQRIRANELHHPHAYLPAAYTVDPARAHRAQVGLIRFAQPLLGDLHVRGLDPPHLATHAQMLTAPPDTVMRACPVRSATTLSTNVKDQLHEQGSWTRH